MSVGKFDKEDDYITKKKTELNEKEAGRGDSWEKNWKSDRQDRFEPSFVNYFPNILNCQRLEIMRNT